MPTYVPLYFIMSQTFHSFKWIYATCIIHKVNELNSQDASKIQKTAASKVQLYDLRLYVLKSSIGLVSANLTESSGCTPVSVSEPDSTFISGI